MTTGDNEGITTSKSSSIIIISGNFSGRLVGPQPLIPTERFGAGKSELLLFALGKSLRLPEKRLELKLHFWISLFSNYISPLYLRLLFRL